MLSHFSERSACLRGCFFPLLGGRLVQEHGSGDHTVQHLSLQFDTFGWAHGIALTRASGFGRDDGLIQIRACDAETFATCHDHVLEEIVEF